MMLPLCTSVTDGRSVLDRPFDRLAHQIRSVPKTLIGLTADAAVQAYLPAGLLLDQVDDRQRRLAAFLEVEDRRRRPPYSRGR
jgi:hypothetical protein